jgi:hypothetical protein
LLGPEIKVMQLVKPSRCTSGSKLNSAYNSLRSRIIWSRWITPM